MCSLRGTQSLNLNSKTTEMITVELPPDGKFVYRIIEPLTQKLQRLIGVDCFFWATLSFTVALIANTLTLLIFFFYLVSSCSKGFTMSSIEDFFVIVVYIFLRLYLQHEWKCEIHGVKTTKKRVYEMIELGLKNPLILFRRPLMSIAIAFLAFAVLDLIHSSPISLLVGFVFESPFIIGYLATCFKACTPLPPRRSKLGEATDKVKKFFTEPIISPIPEPA